MDTFFKDTNIPGNSPSSYDDRARRVALAVQQATGVDRILLFGSRARGDYNAASDIDLLVVHPEDCVIAKACQLTAQEAVRKLYKGAVSTDVVIISPALFASVQFGLNHIAAKAVKDGITPMGNPYHPMSTEGPPQDPFKLEAMERTLHARGEFRTLQRLIRKGETEFYDSLPEYDMAVGRAAQGTLEHALKALIATWRREYARIHNLVELQSQAAEYVPEFQGLKSPLDILSSFAGGVIYGTPQLDQDVEQLFSLVHLDVEHVFALIRSQGGFDPWRVKLSDFKF